LKDIIYKIGYDYTIEIVELELLVDHIHMLVKAAPKECPSQIMQVIKSISARNFQIVPRDQEEIFLGRKIMDAKLFC